jgi:hypothetical protein
MAARDLLQDRTTPVIEKPQKPKSQNADLANLPPALAPLCQQPHWVLWRWERRREKWTKPPYTLAGTNAKSDDPSTWSDYVTALGAMQRANGSVDGLGFMLRGTDLTSVDLDHCFDQSGRPSAWAEAWLETMNGTYVERTPSGEGLRIIGTGAGERLQRRGRSRTRITQKPRSRSTGTANATSPSPAPRSATVPSCSRSTSNRSSPTTTRRRRRQRVPRRLGTSRRPGADLRTRPAPSTSTRPAPRSTTMR